MQPGQPSLELELREAPRVRLRFFWRGDRYAHRLELADWPEGDVGLESLEGDAGDAWPPSPALQQLSVQQGDGGQPCALLLGMAGKSHWSMSVEARASTLWFDVACRLQQQPDRLGSSYRVVEQTPFQIGDIPFVLESEPDEGTLVYDDREGRVAILPPQLTKDLPTTVRWRYRLRLILPGETFSAGTQP
jgi:hypothetical protein